MENTLADTEARYSRTLASLQSQVTGMEQQLIALRADIEKQAQEYKLLLDIKTRLEMEIGEYERLMDGQVTTGKMHIEKRNKNRQKENEETR